MKKEDIPQDEGSLAEKDMRELCYAVDKDGKYSTGLSSGWKPKTVALDLTMEAIKEKAESAKKEVYQGKRSPIYYFMIISKMDLKILAGYMGKARWRIKRHFKPKVFNKLTPEILKKYAEVFDIQLNRIKNFNE